MRGFMLALAALLLIGCSSNSPAVKPGDNPAPAKPEPAKPASFAPPTVELELGAGNWTAVTAGQTVTVPGGPIQAMVRFPAPVDGANVGISVSSGWHMVGRGKAVEERYIFTLRPDSGTTPGTVTVSVVGAYSTQGQQMVQQPFTFHLQPSPPPAGAKAPLEKRAAEVIATLKQKDMAPLAKLVHPDRGVRFSPYAYVNLKQDVVLKAEELPVVWTQKALKLWGHYDGSGEPIKLTFPDYFQRFVYDVDFATAPKVGVNEFIGRGNTKNNLLEAYPGASFVEYHFPGFDVKFEGMDWRSLRLVFMQKDGTWYLVGVVHAQWTI